MPATEHSDDERERCVTGIDAIDHILNGGVPRGNTVLISGSVGTGKTSICIEFLVRGALNGENSLYLSVTEPTDKLLMNVIPFDFFDDKLVRQGKLQFVDLPKIYDKLGIDKEDLDFDQTRLLADTIAGIVEEQKIRRLVLDSVTSVCYRIREQERIRDFLLRLGTVLSAKGCTTLLVSEIRSSEDGYSQWGVEEALADGVIVTGNLERRGDLLRTLQVVKMRGTTHSRAKYVLDLTSAVALHLKADQYFDAIQGLIDRFATKKDLEVVYVTSTIPSQSILNAMEALEIPVEHIWFVDCITQIMMSQAKRHSHSIVVESPTMLENIMLKVEFLLRKNPDRNALVVLDSINSLSIHNNTKILSEFLHILVNNLRARGAYSVIISMQEYETEEIRNMLVLVSDEAVELGA